MDSWNEGAVDKRLMGRCRQRGIALLMVLFALALLGMGLPLLLEQGRQELDQARLLQQRIQARALADAARQLVSEALTERNWRRSSLFWQAQRGEWLDYPSEQGRVRLQIRDLRGCFNVNALAGKETELARQQLLYLLNQQPVSDERLSPLQLVDRLGDWIDSDSRPRAQGAENEVYLRAQPPALVANTLLSDISELNWLDPVDPARYLRYPQLCAVPGDNEAVRLNLNALTLAQLPLFEALYQGQQSVALLRKLILSRPVNGYADAAAVRAVLGSMDDGQINALLDALVLNSDRFEVVVEVMLDEQVYRFSHQLRAQGVSRWAAQVPAQRVQWRGSLRPVL